MTDKRLSIAEISAHLDAEFHGDGTRLINGVAALDQAQADQIAFFNNPRFLSQLQTTSAGCVLLSKQALSEAAHTNVIVLDDPYLGYAKVAQWFDPSPRPAPGIHGSAQISATAQLGEAVSIGAGCVIGDDSVIGDHVILGPNVVIGKGCRIGAHTRMHASVTLYHEVEVGESCIIHSGVVLGADGFGFANDRGRWEKIPQNGRTLIGNQVEIGANSCIDRGALNDTRIGDGVKIDNLCHIAHNVSIGENSAMAGLSGIAGGSTLGANCTMSGRSAIVGHVQVAAGTHVAPNSVIYRSVKKAGVFASGTGMQEYSEWKKSAARFRQLDAMAKRLRELERQMKKLSGD